MDNTVIFSFLRSSEFQDLLKKECALKDSDKSDISDAMKQVWDYVSARFSRTDFRKAATLVCGASKDSSFYREEMLGMLEGDHLKILNDHPADLFRLFRPLGKDELHRLMSITYLLNMRTYARANKSPHSLENYKKQRKYFIVSRNEDKREFAKQPKETILAFRQTRSEILSTYKKNKTTGTTAPTLPLSSALPVTKPPSP